MVDWGIHFQDVKALTSTTSMTFTTAMGGAGAMTLNSDGALSLNTTGAGAGGISLDSTSGVGGISMTSGTDAIGIDIDASAGTGGINLIPGSGHVFLPASAEIRANAFNALSDSATAALFGILTTGVANIATNMTTGSVNIATGMTSGTTTIGTATSTTSIPGGLELDSLDATTAGSTASLFGNLDTTGTSNLATAAGDVNVATAQTDAGDTVDIGTADVSDVTTSGRVVNSQSLDSSQNTSQSAGSYWKSGTIASATLNKVAYSPLLEIFAATSGGSDQTLFWSEDGVTWTATTSDVTATDWQAIAWSPDREEFVAMSTTTTDGVAVSTDGKSWNFYDGPTGNHDWNDVVWASSIQEYVAVGGTGTGRVATSSDPTSSWTTETNAVSQTYYGVADSPELGVIVICGVDGAFESSADGSSWTDRDIGGTDDYRSVAWSPGQGLFIAVSDTTVAGDTIQSSTNGTSWTAETPSESAEWKSVIWVEEWNSFVAVASGSPTNGKVMVSSTPTTSWTSYVSSDETTASWNGLAYSPKLNRVVAVASNGDEVMYADMKTEVGTQQVSTFSTQSQSVRIGDTLSAVNASSLRGNWSWTNRAFAGDESLYIAYSEELEKLVVTQDTGVNVWTSSDAAHWKANETLTRVGPVEWSPDDAVFVMLDKDDDGGGSPFTAQISEDGETWTSATTSPTLACRGLAYDSTLGFFVGVTATSSDDHVYSSDGGDTWTTATATLTATTNWVDVVASGSGAFVALGFSAGIVNFSTNGTSWSAPTTAPPGSSWISGTYGNGRFVIIANAGGGDRIAYSTDNGDNWTSVAAPSAQAWQGVAYSPEIDRFVAVANTTASDFIMVSDDNTATSWHLYPDAETGSEAVDLNGDMVWATHLGRFVMIGTDLLVSARNVGYPSNQITVGNPVSEVRIAGNRQNVFTWIQRNQSQTGTNEPVSWVMTKMRTGPLSPYLDSSDPEKIFVSISGIYHVTYTVATSNSLTDGDIWRTYIRVNGTITDANPAYGEIRQRVGASSSASNSGSDYAFLVAGDFINIVFQAGTSVNVCNGTGVPCRLQMRLVQEATELTDDTNI